MRTTLAVAVVLVLTGCGLVFGVDYTWTNSGETVWADADNWGGGAGYPDGDDDTATIDIDNGGADIDTPAGLTIGELTTGGTFDEKIVCGGTFTTDDGNGESGDMTIGADSTFECQGNALSVANNASISGTLDAFTGGSASVTVGYNFVVNENGTYEATSLTTAIGGDLAFWAGVVFTHNDGTVEMTGADEYFQSGDYWLNPTFYNVTINPSGGDIYPDRRFICENLFYLEGNFRGGSGGFIMTLGDGVTNPGTFHADPGVSVRTYDGPIFQGSISTNFARVTGQNWRWSASAGTAHLKWLDFQSDVDTANGGGSARTITLDGPCSFTNLTLASDDAFEQGAHNVSFNDLTIAGSYTVTTGTNTLTGNFTNSGTFTCGTGTMIFTNSVSVYNNGQPFYDLTVNAGAGNTVTLASGGQVSAISNLLHVASGTGYTEDQLSKDPVGAGTFAPLSMSAANTITCGLSPQIDAGATLVAASPPPSGTLFMIR